MTVSSPAGKAARKLQQRLMVESPTLDKPSYTWCLLMVERHSQAAHQKAGQARGDAFEDALVDLVRLEPRRSR